MIHLKRSMSFSPLNIKAVDVKLCVAHINETKENSRFVTEVLNSHNGVLSSGFLYHGTPTCLLYVTR